MKTTTRLRFRALAPASILDVRGTPAAKAICAMLDLRDAAAFFRLARIVAPDDHMWEALARSYAVSTDFWERAAARPADMSCPLPTWRAELERLVRFDAYTRSQGLPAYELLDFVSLWRCQDTRTSVAPRRSRRSRTVAALTHGSSAVDAYPLAPRPFGAAMASTSVEHSCVPSQARGVGDPSRVNSPKRRRCEQVDSTQKDTVEAVPGATLPAGLSAPVAPEQALEQNHVPERPLSHACLVEQASEADDDKDFLKQLYPHARDENCWMNELQHKYYVHGEGYPYSVSSVWKVFFPQFDTAASVDNAIRSANERGLKCLDTSVFNLAQHLLYVERVSPTSAEGRARVRRAVDGATQWFDRQGGRTPPFTADRVQAAVAGLCAHIPMVKPRKPACYFLSYCLGASETDVREQWRLNGALESFKGTFLHKQAELFMQSLAKQQCLSGRSRVPLRVLLAEPETMRAARHSARPAAVMRLLAAHTSSELWDHPSMQAFLEDQLNGDWSVEFLKFEAWLRSHPELTPFRSEWSIYDEEERLAGQIDSLWLDTDAGDSLVMADWKRAKHRLEADPAVQEKEAFRGERGLATCDTSALPGPCADMFNCDYNHYLAQQNLYAYFLERHYGLRVTHIFLVQCHPEVGLGSNAFHEAPVTYDSALARRMLVAFRDGWKGLLRREES